VRNVRTIAPRADETYESWQQLVPADGTSPNLPPGSLRARQIAEALRALEEKHHLV